MARQVCQIVGRLVERRCVRDDEAVAVVMNGTSTKKNENENIVNFIDNKSTQSKTQFDVTQLDVR